MRHVDQHPWKAIVPTIIRHKEKSKLPAHKRDKSKSYIWKVLNSQTQTHTENFLYFRCIPKRSRHFVRLAWLSAGLVHACCSAGRLLQSIHLPYSHFLSLPAYMVSVITFHLFFFVNVTIKHFTFLVEPFMSAGEASATKVNNSIFLHIFTLHLHGLMNESQEIAWHNIPALYLISLKCSNST